MGIILNLQEGESSSLELALCITCFSMKLYCRNTSKHTHTYSLSPPVREEQRWNQEEELVEKSVCDGVSARPVL